MQLLGWVAQDCTWVSCTPSGEPQFSQKSLTIPCWWGGGWIIFLFSSLQYSGFQQSADRCFLCGHLIMDMVSVVQQDRSTLEGYKLIIEHNVFFLVCGHCWFYLKNSLPSVATSSLIEAIVGLDQCNFNHAPWSDSAHTGLPLISLWSSSPFPVRC